MKSIAHFCFASVCVTQEAKLLCGHYCTPTAFSFAFISDRHNSYINVRTFNVKSCAARARRVEREGLGLEHAVSVWQRSFIFSLSLLKTWNTVSWERSTLVFICWGFVFFLEKWWNKSWTWSLSLPSELILKSFEPIFFYPEKSCLQLCYYVMNLTSMALKMYFFSLFFSWVKEQ